jgi:hypothetical protein
MSSTSRNFVACLLSTIHATLALLLTDALRGRQQNKTATGAGPKLLPRQTMTTAAYWKKRNIRAGEGTVSR